MRSSITYLSRKCRLGVKICYIKCLDINIADEQVVFSPEPMKPNETRHHWHLNNNGIGC